MGFLKRLFGLEKKEEPKQEETQQTESINNERRYIEDACALCHNPIGQDRWKKVQEKFIHKKCFKKRQREVLNGQF